MLKTKTILIAGILLSIRATLGTTFGTLNILVPSEPLALETLIDGQNSSRRPAETLVPPEIFESLDFSLNRSLRLPETMPVPHVTETWIDLFTEAEVQAIDGAFPYLGFGLAWHIARSGKTSIQEIFGDSLADFNPQSGSCRNMKKGKFQNETYILKPKNCMGLRGSSLRVSYQNARNEAEAGAQTRQAVVDAFLDNGRNLDRMLAEFDFLINLVAPIDCGDYIVSLAILNAISLHDIVYVDRTPYFSFSTAKQLSGDVPVPDFGSDDGAPISRKTLFPGINFGQARERIDMILNIIRLIQFLHANRIAHNDSHPGNFLIVGNDYTRMSLIDLDQATCGRQFSSRKDFETLIELTTKYLFGTKKGILPGLIDASWIEKIKNLDLKEILDDPETFSYTNEELEQIRKILLNLLTALFTA
ncbi:MAG: hypothetical protein LBF34_03685 [Puniceicoccales bacterium]|jgi:hypothetical protein|nr:hypothetical protein [Puniceicoccales bacterium]